jgi:hypothetical protein
VIDERAISIEFTEFNQLKYKAVYTVKTALLCKYRTYFSNQSRTAMSYEDYDWLLRKKAENKKMKEIN